MDQGLPNPAGETLDAENGGNREVERLHSSSSSESCDTNLQEILEYNTDSINEEKKLHALCKQESLQMEDLELSSNPEEDASSGKSNSKNRESEEIILNIKAAERNLPRFEGKSVSNIPEKQSTATALGERDLILQDDPNRSCSNSIFEGISASPVQDDEDKLLFPLNSSFGSQSIVEDGEYCYPHEDSEFDEIQSITNYGFNTKALLECVRDHILTESEATAIVCHVTNRYLEETRESISNDNFDSCSSSDSFESTSTEISQTSLSDVAILETVQTSLSDVAIFETVQTSLSDVAIFETVQTSVSGEENPKDFKRSPICSPEEGKPTVQMTPPKNSFLTSDMQQAKRSASMDENSSPETHDLPARKKMRSKSLEQLERLQKYF